MEKNGVQDCRYGYIINPLFIDADDTFAHAFGGFENFELLQNLKCLLVLSWKIKE